MDLYITMVGEQRATHVEAYNDYEAVAEIAGCTVHAVCLPIWRRGRRSRWNPQDYTERCYMPRDNTGRQWLVKDER